MNLIFTLCFSLLFFLPNIGNAGGNKIAPSGTQYIRKNQFGGHDFYNRSGKIGYSRGSNNRYNYYNRSGTYMRTNNNRIYNKR